MAERSDVIEKYKYVFHCCLFPIGPPSPLSRSPPN